MKGNHADWREGCHNSGISPRSRKLVVFAEQKERMDLFIRTVGVARATTKIGLANLVYNIKRLIFLRRAVLHDGLQIASHPSTGQFRPSENCQPKDRRKPSIPLAIAR